MAMTREQARAAALKLRALKPELQAMNLDTLIAKIMVNEGNAAIGEGVMTPGGMSRETAFEGLPQSAIASALMLNPPQMVTPASPAPMRPGTTLVAPKPTAPAVGGPFELPEDVRQQSLVEAVPAAAPAAPVAVMEEAPAAAPKREVRPSRYRQALADTLSEIKARQEAVDLAKANKTPVPITDQARLTALNERAKILQGYVQAEESAEVPEEMLGVLNKQEERLKRREEMLAETKRLSPWQALLAGSAAMSQGARKGERVGDALSRGLQIGLQSYAQAKNQNAEGLEAIGEARDAAVMKRYDLLQKARDDAVAMVASGQKIDKDVLELSKMNDEQAMRLALMPLQIRKGEAETKLAEFELSAAPIKLQASLALNQQRINKLKKGDSGSPNKIQAAGQLLSSLDREASGYEDTIADLTASPQDKKNARAALKTLNGQRGELRAIMSGGVVGTRKPAATGGKGGRPAGVSAEVWNAMTPQEKKLFQ